MAWKFNPFTGSLDYYESDTDTGEVNTASNLTSGAGTEADAFKSKVGVDLQFRALKQGSGITLTENANDITIDAPLAFTSSMNVYSRSFDHDNAWVIGNNAAVFKLGGAGDTTPGDTETADLGSTASGIMQRLWFIAPFDMIVTNVSGAFQDDDMLTHLSSPLNYAGIWVIEGFSAAGSTPHDNTGTQTFVLKYITTGVYLNNGFQSGFAWHDSSPSCLLTAGDAVFAGTLIPRSATNDDGTLTMTICGREA